ncbi:hypothetical protein XENTR_v10018690 [Xenopus tropicalis]|nr:hypothetical protein XENTR_v10018689 [Xenopus tropicalis]KAE8592212.1 hypothetical protein XENTR_v10018690 [Xenopus tropicalis]
MVQPLGCSSYMQLPHCAAGRLWRGRGMKVKAFYPAGQVPKDVGGQREAGKSRVSKNRGQKRKRQGES